MILVFSLVMHRMLCVALSFVFANTSYVILGCWRVAVSTAVRAKRARQDLTSFFCQSDVSRALESSAPRADRGRAGGSIDRNS